MIPCYTLFYDGAVWIYLVNWTVSSRVPPPQGSRGTFTITGVLIVLSSDVISSSVFNSKPIMSLLLFLHTGHTRVPQTPSPNSVVRSQNDGPVDEVLVSDFPQEREGYGTLPSEWISTLFSETPRDLPFSLSVSPGPLYPSPVESPSEVSFDDISVHVHLSWTGFCTSHVCHDTIWCYYHLWP